MKRVFRYLKGTINAKITCKKGDVFKIYGFCDADYAGDVSDRRSCTVYAFMCQGAISWCSKRQATVLLSTTEAVLRLYRNQNGFDSFNMISFLFITIYH